MKSPLNGDRAAVTRKVCRMKPFRLQNISEISILDG